MVDMSVIKGIQEWNLSQVTGVSKLLAVEKLITKNPFMMNGERLTPSENDSAYLK